MTAAHTYVTTTIPYVNARPHIGFALELVQADVLARFRRARGNRVRPWELAKAAGNGAYLDAALRLLLDACQTLGRELSPFLPGAAARIAAQCTPGEDGRLPSPSPVFRRLAPRPSAGTPG